MQNQKNQISLHKLEGDLKSNATLNELGTFFYTFSKKEIRENNSRFKHWTNVLLETEYLNEPEHRKELIRIGDMVNALDAIAGKFSTSQIMEALSFLTENKVKTETKIAKQIAPYL